MLASMEKGYWDQTIFELEMAPEVGCSRMCPRSLIPDDEPQHCVGGAAGGAGGAFDFIT